MLSFLTATLSRPGPRSENEDYCDFREVGGWYCWVVADGLGAHAGGEFASEAATLAIMNAFRPANLSVTGIESLVDTAHQGVHNAQVSSPQRADMRTTIVVLVSNGRHALWAHVGDSRLYHFRRARLVGRTLDHSVAQALVAAAEISPEALRAHPDRNRLLRSLGDSDARPAIPEKKLRLEPEDAFLICTDGWWERITEDEMTVDLVKAGDPALWLRMMERRLIEKGPRDNYSAIAVFTGPHGVASPVAQADSCPDEEAP
jgi:serine/threonine protein phosphatase PrpC